MSDSLAPDPNRPNTSGWFLAIAVGVALIPTILSAQGMVMVAVDALRLPLMVAIGLAAFLELSLILFAWMARRQVVLGQNPRQDLMATWLFSAASGCLSAAHETVAANGHMREITPLVLIAVSVRIVAPLVACLVWHRAMVQESDVFDQRPTRLQVRQHRDTRRVADAALRVRRSEPGTPEFERAQKELERAYSTFQSRWLHQSRAMTLADPRENAMANLRELTSLAGQVDAIPSLTGTQIPRQPSRPKKVWTAASAATGLSADTQTFDTVTYNHAALRERVPLVSGKVASPASATTATGEEPAAVAPAETKADAISEPPAASPEDAELTSTIERHLPGATWHNDEETSPVLRHIQAAMNDTTEVLGEPRPAIDVATSIAMDLLREDAEADTQAMRAVYAQRGLPCPSSRTLQRGLQRARKELQPSLALVRDA